MITISGQEAVLSFQSMFTEECDFVLGRSLLMTLED